MMSSVIITYVCLTSWFKWGVFKVFKVSSLSSGFMAPGHLLRRSFSSLQLTNAWEIPYLCALKVNTSNLFPLTVIRLPNDQYWGGLIIQIDAKEFVTTLSAYGLVPKDSMINFACFKEILLGILFLWTFAHTTLFNVIGYYLHVLRLWVFILKANTKFSLWKNKQQAVFHGINYCL